jgi:hypothetical protein
MVALTQHSWILTGPWYRWRQPNNPADGRLSHPVLQKYETANLVDEFLKNPQHSLKFLDPEDFVLEVRLRTPLLPLIGGKKQRLSDKVCVRTDVRKLFLNTHKRFYLVVCELHCDTPGFPSVSRDQVCEAGFVIRRRITVAPPAADKAAVKALQHMILAGEPLVEIDPFPTASSRGPLAAVRQAAKEKYLAATADVRAAVKKLGIRVVLQGWLPSEFERVGYWQEVEATPQEIKEQMEPLYPLIPDPQQLNHAGRGRTIYFGLVPTSSSDFDQMGNARFDDRNLYEIRCFVRRHKLQCPKKNTRGDCHGELIWSQRTEPYQLAAPFDLIGTSNRPVTILLPDIPALEAQVAAMPVGQGAPVKMISPAGSPDFSVNPKTLQATLKPPPKSTSASICSFSIPLITIVAMFVFRLFLPVVTLLLNLFFLLKLKFCIPPTVDLSAGAAAGLNATFGADITTKLEAEFTTEVVEKDIAGGLAKDFSASAPPGIDIDPAPAGAVQAELPTITTNLVWEDTVKVEVS